MRHRASFTGCLVLATMVACAHNDLLEEKKVEQVIACSGISDAPADLTQRVPAKYAALRALPLRQHWAGTMPMEAGVARIGATSLGLAVHVRYEDSDVFSTATANQQRMWTLGDVVEVFVRPGREQSAYWEVHVTPNEFLMDLYIPSRAGMQSGEHTWEDMITPESGTVYQAYIDDGSWSAELTIPWSAFGQSGIPAEGTTWQFAVCRYNYNGGLEGEELSSTAPLSQRNYHLVDEYMDLTF
jgi:hypothetical protein